MTKPKVCTIGIDIGTSSVKVGLLELNRLKLIDLASRGYASSMEQKPEIIWTAVVKTLKEISKQIINNNIELKAIGLSGQMNGTVIYGENDKIIAPIINWQDRRCDKPLKKYNSKNTIEKIEEIIGRDANQELGIDRMASGFLGATLFFMMENNKKFFKKIKHVLLPSDFIRKRLTSEKNYITDNTNAFGTGLFNVKENNWHYKFIEKLGLPLKIFPTVKETDYIVGYTSINTNKLLCLSNRIPIIVGGGDNQLGAIGSGLYNCNSPILLNIGTGSQVSKVIDNYNKLDGIDTRSFMSNRYLYVGASLGGGESYNWLKEKIKKEIDKNMDFKQMDELASKVEPGSNGLFYSTGPSRINPKRKKGFFGSIELMKSPGHMARAVMEGVLFDLYRFYILMGGSDDKELIGSGNGIKNSSVWSGIASDIFGLKLKITDYENTVFGAALIAAKGIGLIPDFEHVFRTFSYKEVKSDQDSWRKYRRILKQQLNNEKI